MKPNRKPAEKKVCTQLRIPMSLYKDLKKNVVESYQSQNQLILQAIREFLKSKKEAL